MELLVREAGFTPTEAIAAATGVAARAAGVEDSRGTLAAGKLADLVVLRADPTADIRNTREIEFVVKRGRIVE
jgi:imidazolonepropionase-like amidohydrolase